MALHLSRSCGRRFCECLYDFDNATVVAADDAPAVSKNVNGIEGRNLLLLFFFYLEPNNNFKVNGPEIEKRSDRESITSIRCLVFM